MTLEASPALDGCARSPRPGLPVDARGDLPDAATLGRRLDGALTRAAGAGLDVELHVDAEPLPAPHAQAVDRARASAAVRGIDVRIVS